MGLRSWLFGRKKKHASEVIQHIKNDKLTYLSDDKLKCIARTCKDIKKDNIKGIFLEAGCALGGSAILIASLKPQKTPLFLYDVFGMIPPPTDEDPPEVHGRYKIIKSGQSIGIDGDPYYGYIDNLEDLVRHNLSKFNCDCERNNILLIKGLLQDTMNIDHPVAFAHIDVDWYDPVKACIERVFPRLSINGSIIFDDYFDWGGCKKAVDEYLLTIEGKYRLDSSAGSMKVIKIAS